MTGADVHAVVQVVVGWWSERGRGARERDRALSTRAGPVLQPVSPVPRIAARVARA